MVKNAWSENAGVENVGIAMCGKPNSVLHM